MGIAIHSFFLFDILFTLRTSFYSDSGEIVKNPKEIAKYYLFSFGFVVDLIASIPHEYFFG